jgi:hypothetical protein
MRSSMSISAETLRILDTGGGTAAPGNRITLRFPEDAVHVFDAKVQVAVGAGAMLPVA